MPMTLPIRSANTIVKRPGYSEHNTGLAADVGGSGNYSLNQNFENTDAYRWLIAHCADYGFILRFPKDKEGSGRRMCLWWVM